MLPMLFNENALVNRLFDLGEAPAQTYAPAFHVYETGSTWELLLDVPGVAKEDLKVTVEAGTVTVRGSRKAPEVKEGCASHSHRWAGELARTFKLGDGLDTSKVEANLKDGVLRLSIAKAETARPREIAIQ